MVAGAYKAELLADFRSAVDKAIARGTTLGDFRKDFDAIVARHGWSYKGGRNWRSEVIYSTNIRTSYMAGRWEQLNDPEVKKFYGFLEYRHGDSRIPRPQHLAWDGLVLPAGDPWWKTHYPPNGWGCKCRAFAATKEEHDAALNEGKGKAPPSPIDPKTGEPAGIDKGWGYNVGMAAGQRFKILEGAIERLPEDLRTALRKEIAGADRRIKAAPVKAEKKTPAAFDADRLKAVPNSQKGSMPGGLYEDDQGKRYYVKFYPDAAQARSEYAASRIYRLLGVDTPEIRLAEMAAPGGERRLAVISAWRDDLKRIGAEEMVRHPEEMAKIFHASALVKNWDVVGLEYDNLLLGREGRLAIIDSGGSFRFRARGGAKNFGAVPDEVKAFRDSRINPQSAKVFNEVFRSNVWLEREGAEPILKLAKADVKRVFAEAGFDAAEAKELTETLWQRRQWLIGRYDLENLLVPEGFGDHLNVFKQWGTQAWTPRVVNELVAGAEEAAFRQEMDALVAKFEEYVRSSIHPYARGVARALFSEWSGSSSSTGGATIKAWAEERFGMAANYHYGSTDRASISSQLRSHVDLSLSKAKLDRETVFRILDAEYEFHQYYLRRLHGYEDFPAIRYVTKQEFKTNYARGSWKGNAVQSVTVKVAGFGGQKAVRITLRVEDAVKTFLQGVKYMHYGAGESEYIVLGRMRNAAVVK